MITHFFNYNFQDTDFERQYKTKNTIPRFMTEL